MTWRVSLHEEPDDREIQAHNCATLDEAVRLAGELEDPAYDNRYIRFRTPAWATPEQIEELKQVGLVNGEVADAF